MTEQTTETKKEAGSSGVGYAIAGVLVVIALGAVTRFLEQQVPHWAVGTPFAKITKSIEFPVYAIALGLIGNLVLSKLALRDALSKGFRTELSSRPAWSCSVPRSTSRSSSPLPDRRSCRRCC